MGKGRAIGYLQLQYAERFWTQEKTWEGMHGEHPGAKVSVNDYVVKIVSGRSKEEKT